MATLQNDCYSDWEDDRDVESISTLTEDGIMTPTTETENNFPEWKIPRASMATSLSDSERDFIQAVPQPDKTYKIHLHGTDLLITLEEGQLQLQRSNLEKPGGGWFWTCVEKSGWLGFRNHVSGTYLGRDSKGGLQATRKHHKDWESFCVRHDPRGGYTILVKYYGDGLWKVALSADRKGLIETEDRGVQWDFEEV